MRTLLIATAVLACSLWTAPALAAKPLTVSVLYFDNNTGSAEYEPMKKGLADMLTSDLAQLPGVTVVERERLQAVLDEQRLTRSALFDAKTAVATGKLLGATHVVVGAIAALQPQVRLDIRLIDVASADVKVSGQVVGRSEDLFELEQELVRRFAGGLAVKDKGLVTSRASVAALLAYSQGLDASDRGDLEGARAPLTSALQAAPTFALARKRYAELLAKLDAAAQVRGVALSADEQLLRQHIAEWTRTPLASVPVAQQEYAMGYRMAEYLLGVAKLRDLAAPRRGMPVVVVPVSQRAALAQLETQLLTLAASVVAELVALKRGVQARLFPDDNERLRTLVGNEIMSLRTVTAGSMAADAARLALLGEEPHSRLIYRPTLAQRDPGVIATHLAGLDLEIAEQDERNSAWASFSAWDSGAEGLLLAGQRDAAVARWQRFLDLYPKAEAFKQARAHIEEVLLVSPEVTRAQADLDACRPAAQVELQVLLHAVLRAEGRAGVKRVVDKVEACAPKLGNPTGIMWRSSAWYGCATEALQRGDCELFKQARVKVTSLGANYAAIFSQYQTRCDER